MTSRAEFNRIYDESCNKIQSAHIRNRAVDAMRHAKLGHELAIRNAIHSWCDYADAHLSALRSAIGSDGVLGPYWMEWGQALRKLLNGETGRFDCHAIELAIRGVMLLNEMDPDKD